MNPEDKNSASTTVGGVTFGGGASLQPKPENTTAPAASTMPTFEKEAKKDDIDPIVASTGDEFDAIMNGIENKEPQAPVPSNLSVPVASPTHFDNQNTVNPIVKDPGGPSAAEAMNAAKAAPEKPAPDPTKQAKKAGTLTVIFGVLTLIFAIAAIVALVLNLSTNIDLNDAKTELEAKTKIVKKVEESSGLTINSPEDVPIYKATTGYIYISEWNIKIKIPDNLEKVSYILNQNYRPSICFNAVQKGVQYFPDFANVALNPGKMGCLTRIATSEGGFDAATGASFGTNVFTYKEFNYFYTGSIDYSKDAANLGLEHTAVQIIKNMLTDNIEPYE